MSDSTQSWLSSFFVRHRGARNFAILVTALGSGLSLLIAFWGVTYTLWLHFCLLEPHRNHGVKAVATITEIETVGLKRTRRLATVEHRSEKTGQLRHNWLDDGAIQVKTFNPSGGGSMPGYTSKYGKRDTPLVTIGDKIDIVYLPGVPRSQSVLKEDLLPENKPLLERHPWIAFLLVFSAIFLFRGVKWLNRQEQIADKQAMEHSIQ